MLALARRAVSVAGLRDLKRREDFLLFALYTSLTFFNLYLQVKLSNLAHLLVGGEALPWNLAKETTVKLPHVNLWNMYGPAEATSMFSTQYSVSHSAAPHLSRYPTMLTTRCLVYTRLHNARDLLITNLRRTTSHVKLIILL